MRSSSTSTHPVHVIGATGRSGQAVCRALAMLGTPVVPIARNPAKAKGLINLRVADLNGPAAPLRAAMADATRIVCTAPARTIPGLLAAATPSALLACLGKVGRAHG